MSQPWGAPETETTPAPSGPRVRYGLSQNAQILIVIWLAAGAGLQFAHVEPQLLTFLFVVTGWVLSVAVHEFGHAVVAYRAGDWTVGPKGYLTGDPFRYTDIFTSIILPLVILALGGIGFPGGAVYLREDLMRSRWWRAAASLAGPAGTLLVFLVLALVTRLLMMTPGLALTLAGALACLVFLQATALILNLLPLPGLDGYGVIRAYLPPALRRRVRPFEPLGILALIAVVLFVPEAGSLLFGGAGAMMDLVGIPRALAGIGLSALQFWKH